MPISTPQARLPLEPEEYPLYRPPRRLGCSGLSIVAVILLVVFGVLFWKVTPPIIQSIRSFSPTSLLSGEAPVATPGEGGMETQTVEAAIPSPTLGPVETPTPQVTCVKVTGTGGLGTPMRTSASLTAESVIKDGTRKIGEGAVLEVIGPDVTSGKDTAGKDIVWMHVRLRPPDGRAGYVLGKYLETASCPGS